MARADAVNKHYRDRAVVLRTIPLGEADRIVTLMTENHGRVRAVAKGIRRTTSKFGSRLEPTTHVSLQLYLGRELDTITQAETIAHMTNVRDDLHRFGRANVMLETVDQVALEREPNHALYRMLAGALGELDRDDAPLVLAGFLLKLLALEGFQPQIDVCVACGSASNLVAFDVDDGGLRCIDDRRGVAVDPEAIFLMRSILGGELAAALREPASASTAEVEAIAIGLVEHHIERRLRAARTRL
ncbi:MAG TPA: DNA repair protein RecO [Acidimicrobiales bacterium]|nr:DNA repair protein RecO [Acidimicrobiales bacterium]